MEELMKTGTYSEFKNSLDRELKEVAAGFVRIGYLLKVARDTDILYESGYKSVAEFAQAEYGLTKDIVSRYIAINDRYSEGGYSERLQEKFEGYGVAKLAEMLTLPDSVVEELDPRLTRAEIQEVKRELKEEEQISGIEVMLEGRNTKTEGMDMLGKFMFQYFHDNHKDFSGIVEAAAWEGQQGAIERILDVLAPSGVGVKMARIQGIGKLMLSIRGTESDVEVLNVRSNEKEIYTWEKVVMTVAKLFEGLDRWDSKDAWEEMYGESYPVETPAAEEKKTTERMTETKGPTATAEKMTEPQTAKTTEKPINTKSAPVFVEEKAVAEAPEENVEVAPVQQPEGELAAEPEEEFMPKPVEESQQECESGWVDKVTGVKEGFLRQSIGEKMERLQDYVGRENWRTAYWTAAELAKELQELAELTEKQTWMAGREEEHK